MSQQRQSRWNRLILSLVFAWLLSHVVAGAYLTSLFWIAIENTNMQAIINGATPEPFVQALGVGLPLSFMLTNLFGIPLFLAGWGMAHTLTSRRFVPLASFLTAVGIFLFYTLFGLVFRQTDRLDALATPVGFVSPIIVATVFGLAAAAIVSRLGYEKT